MLRYLALFITLAVAATADELSCKSSDGREIADGSTFQLDDGCTRCTCYRGAIGCTEMPCTAPQGCNYKGNLYIVGQEFKDECNTCLCGENGDLACTRMYCPPQCVEGDQTYEEGDSYLAADGCNTCTCLKGGVSACTAMACI